MESAKNGSDVFNAWRGARGLSIATVAEAIGDTKSGQLSKWACGARDRLPTPLLVKLARHTGLPLRDLALPEQYEMAQQLFAVLARDAADTPKDRDESGVLDGDAA